MSFSFRERAVPVNSTTYLRSFSGDELTKAMTELILNLLDENIELREEAARAMEIVLKEAGGFPDQIRQLLQVIWLQITQTQL